MHEKQHSQLIKGEKEKKKNNVSCFLVLFLNRLPLLMYVCLPMQLESQRQPHQRSRSLAQW